jgi:4-amino-4-deoxy-L-arabinose transferase-like glycosyltransferase
MKINQSLKKFIFSWSFFLVLIILVIYFSFGLYHLGKFATADEKLWLYNPTSGRILAYWNAIKDHEWTKTRINDKPGITLAYVSGIVVPFEKNPDSKIIEKEGGFRIYDRNYMERWLFRYRLPILFFNGLSIFFFYWILKRLTGNSLVAITTNLFIFLSPIIIGVSQIVNPDALLWTFSFAAFLTFLLFIKEKKFPLSILSGIFLGLALATKYTAIILPLFFGLIIWLYIWFRISNDNSQDLHRDIVKLLMGFGLAVISMIALFCLMMPAVFIVPRFLLEGTLAFKSQFQFYWLIGLYLFFNLILFLDAIFLESKIIKSIFRLVKSFYPILIKVVIVLITITILICLYNYTVTNNILGIVKIPFDYNRGELINTLPLFELALLEIKPLVYLMTPIVLFAFIALSFYQIFERNKNQDFADFFLHVCFLFVLIFFLAVIAQKLLVHVRYSLIIYPFVAYIAAVGIERLRKNLKLTEKAVYVIFSVLIFISIISINSIKPYYFNYTSSLLPKNDIITGAWGYGGYEAAQYLNSINPDQQGLAWTDYSGFCEFYNGKCIKAGEYDKFLKERPDEKIDYFVQTRRGTRVNDNLWKKFENDGLINANPVWELNIGKRPMNFVRVYKANQI